MGVLDKIKAISAAAWLWAELGNRGEKTGGGIIMMFIMATNVIAR